MYCKKCGNKIIEDSKFCSTCGDGIENTLTNNPSLTKNTLLPTTGIFRGRIGRLNFFLGGLLGLAPVFLLTSIWGLLAILSSVLGLQSLVEIISLIIPILIALSVLFFFVFRASLLIRRCHDLGRTGWFSLWGWVPYINFIFALYFLFAKGNPDVNKYGDVPTKRKFFKDIFNY